MKKTIIDLYRRFRPVANTAKEALSSAKTVARFRELESSGLVRLRCEPERENYFHVYGKPEGYTGANGRRVSAEQERDEIVALLDQHGLWWTCSEAWDGSKWVECDSCGMHMGYRNPIDPLLNPYIVDEMGSAVDMAERFLREPSEVHDAACRDIETTAA